MNNIIYYLFIYLYIIYIEYFNFILCIIIYICDDVGI